LTQLTSCPDPQSVAERAAAHTVRALARAREQRGVAHLALSGGTSPGRTYELLAREPAELEAVEVWFADERCVPPEDEQSNYRLARETLLEPAGLPAERVHRMEGELGPHEGAERYAAVLRERVATGEPAPASEAVPVLDLVLLGIGPDGHVASLFPGAPTLDAPADAICLGVTDSPKPPPERITLSLPVLRAARECLLLATGAGKADAVSAMLGEPSKHVPASLLRRERLTVIVDDAAAPPAPLG
jgi:6-phosphogluconolactonase